MKILHVIADGRPGGGTTSVLALTEDQRSLGHDVALLTDASTYAAITAHTYGVAVQETKFFVSRFDPRVPTAIHKATRRIHPDVVHVHGARAGFLHAVQPTLPQAARVYTVHGYHFLHKPFGIRHLAATAERLASSRVDLTVHVCHYDAQLARRWRFTSPAGSMVIHNGIRPSDVPPSKPTEAKLIVTLGRLTHQKDPGMVLAVARKLGPKGYRFRLIGGGDLETAIRNEARDHALDDVVEVTGSLPRDAALEAMRDADVFFLPSRWEGFPIAPIEAMTMGIPVVLSNVSGMPEVVGDDAGILVDRHDAAAYAQAIEQLVANADLRASIVSHARKRVAERFTRPIVTEAYVKAYERILDAA